VDSVYVYYHYIGIDLEWIESASILTLGMLDVSRQSDGYEVHVESTREINWKCFAAFRRYCFLMDR
jgi:hypothetical protein